MQNLYSKNNEGLLKEIKGDLNKWKTAHLWMGLNIVKMAIYLKLNSDLIPIKIPAGLFAEIDKVTLKFI